MLAQTGGDVLAEVLRGPVGVGGADDGESGRQRVPLGELGDRREQQPAGEVAGGSEEHHALDHDEPFGLSVVDRVPSPSGPAYRGAGGPATPGRQTKTEPASGCVRTVLRFQVEPGRRDVQVTATGAAEGEGRRVAGREGHNAVEDAVRPVPVHGSGPPAGNPQHPLVVDGHPVRPPAEVREVDEGSPMAEPAGHEVELEQVHTASRCVGQVHPPPGLVQGRAVGDRQPVDDSGHPGAVQTVQAGHPWRFVVRHGAEPAPTKGVRLDVVRPIPREVLFDRHHQFGCAADGVERGQPARGGHEWTTLRIDDDSSWLPRGGPRLVGSADRLGAVNGPPRDVHPPQAGCRRIPERALAVLRTRPHRDLDRHVTHVSPPLVRSVVRPVGPVFMADSGRSVPTRHHPRWMT